MCFFSIDSEQWCVATFAHATCMETKKCVLVFIINSSNGATLAQAKEMDKNKLFEFLWILVLKKDKLDVLFFDYEILCAATFAHAVETGKYVIRILEFWFIIGYF